MNSIETFQEAVGRYAGRVMKTRAGEPVWLTESRQEAAGRFLATGFPTEREELWRYTDLTPLLSIPFKPDVETDPKMVASLLKEVLEVPGARRMVFVNGRYQGEHSAPGAAKKGLRLENLASALRNGFTPSETDWEQSSLGRAFSDLNQALFEDGALVQVDRGVVVEEPIHLVFLSTNKGIPSESHTRNFIRMEEGSQATVVESHLGGPNQHFTNTLTQASLGPGAVLNHSRIQEESLFTGYSIGALAARLDKDSHLWSGLASLGGHKVRAEAVVRFLAPGAECELDGTFLSRCMQHVDCRTFVDHAVPGCKSRQDYKGVLDGRSTGVFEGRILVRENAQQTDARQSNKNLLMSQEAVAYSKPQLEIYANDVKCAHGSATGPVDPNALFYLRSRGINLPDARRTLVRGFVGEVLDRFKPEAWVEALKRRTRDWLIRPEDMNEKDS